MSSVIRDRDELERKIEEAGEKLIVIDFFANWCGPCRVISPKLEELAKKYEQQAAVFKVNVDDCEDIALDFNVTSMPTFVFMRNKNVVDTFVGGNTDKLVQNMQKYVTGIDTVSDDDHGGEEATAAVAAADDAKAAAEPSASNPEPPIKNKSRGSIGRKSKNLIPAEPADEAANTDAPTASNANALQPTGNDGDEKPNKAAKEN